MLNIGEQLHPSLAAELGQWPRKPACSGTIEEC
jgi:hypothetical protein